MLAPIVLFTYNRLSHTKQTVEALQKNHLAKDSILFVFSDGPKNDQDILLVNEVRNYLKKVVGFKTVEVIARDNNIGLARSIISGVTKIVNKFGKLIVLEDDLITSSDFLGYMNQALDIYEKEDKVISIHGYSYPIKGKLPETYFLKGADCWGWATWKRGWDLFENDGCKLLLEIEGNKLIKKEFDIGGYPYTKMLKDQIAGRNDSWAIRWRASALLANKYTLYPGFSLVQNIGFDGSGTHGGKNLILKTNLLNRMPDVVKQPIEENIFVKNKLRKYFFMLSFFVKLKFFLRKFKCSI